MDDLNNTEARIGALLVESAKAENAVRPENLVELNKELQNLYAKRAAQNIYLKQLGFNTPFSFTGNQTTVPNLADK